MQYRKEIDGLRSIAVLPVILFHAGFSVFSGGYVGVDVFFVISGYLITSILIGELEQGSFSILRFYERRARRILPALFTVMLACLPFAYIWMPLPSQLKDFAQSLIAVVFFVSNILFWRESGYFAPAAELKPLLHTWSLAVEEQYYLIFPIFLLLAWRFGRNKVFWCVAAISAFSFLLSEWGWRNAPGANFYLAPTRAWELLAGSICAFLTVGQRARSSNSLSFLGLALIVFSIFSYDENTPFPSVYALVPVAGASLIILFAHKDTWTARLLSTRGFVGIGLISYSAYLWHQPLFAFARLRNMTEPSHSLMAVLGLASLVLAWGTWHWVEQPFRRGKNSLLVARQSVFIASGAVGAIIIAIGLAGYLGKGFERRLHSDMNLADLDERLSLNHGLHKDCEGNFNNSQNCYSSKFPKVLLWGDSFAMHLAPGIVASDEDVALQQHTKSDCAPVLGIAAVNRRNTKSWAAGCIEFNDLVLDWLHANDTVELVVLSSPLQQLLEDHILNSNGELVSDPSVDFVADRIRETIQAIRQTGARVVLVSPTPRNGLDLGQCLVRAVYFEANEASCDFALNMETEAFDALKSVSDTVAVYWLYQDFCRDGLCDAMQNNIFIYRDEGHLSKEGSAHLGRKHDWLESFSKMAN